MSAQVTILQLPAAAAITGTEAVPIVQNGVTVQTTTAALAGSPVQTYSYLTVLQTPQLANSRYVGATNGLTVTDGGAQGVFNITTTGALSSLVSSGIGIQVKTSSTAITGRSVTSSGAGLSVTNGSGVSGDPTVALSGQVLNFANASFNGLVTLSTGGAITSSTITGTASQIDVANGTGVSGNPTISLSSDPVIPGTGGVVVPAGTTGQRGTSVNGNLRYNSTTASFEGYANGAWGTIPSGVGVNSISFGTTGLTPATATTGAVTVAGTLAVANGGTGVTTSTGTTNVVLSNSPTLVTPAITTSVTTASTSFNLLNTTATTLNFGGAATTLNLGAATGTMTVANTTLAAKAITASTTLGVTGVSTFAAGTAALPAITTTGGTNTGVFFPSVSSLALSTSGSERLRVISTGEVGIGATPTTASKTSIVNTSAGASTIALSLQNASDTIASETILDFVTNTQGTGVRSAQITAINTTGSTGVNMVFKIANGAPPAEAMRITSLGGLQLTKGLGVSGTTPGTTGVAFPATAVAVADANTLDDYEEGTWTPVVTFSGGNGDLTTSEAVGVYTKIGRLVQIAFNLEFTETTALTNLTITGVPFTSGGSVRTFVGCWVDNMSALVGSPIAGLAVASTTISMQTTGTGGAALITNANTGASSRVRGSLSYSV